jgi:hypothetical protein
VNTGLTLDAGALIALDRDDRRFAYIIKAIILDEESINIPAPVLAQVIRNPATQARILRVLQYPKTQVVPLDRDDAMAIGALLRRTNTRDIADAHVVICARRAQERIATTDPDDLRRLDPDLDLIVL